MTFRRDRSPNVDVGVKQDLLHMLLRSYNPVWLKLGLEVRERKMNENSFFFLKKKASGHLLYELLN